MQNVKILIATLVLTLVAVFGLSWLSKNWLAPSPGTSSQLSVPESELIANNPHVRGATESAQYTIVEFSDFECPACASVSPYLEDIVARYPDKVRLVYRHFPLVNIHPLAYRMAEISEAAATQNKFWEMHDYLFDHQIELSEMSVEQLTQTILDRSQEIGVDSTRLEADLLSGQYQTNVEEDLRYAERLGLSFTPSIFLNGTLTPIDQLEKAISQ
jgi:protein-disulfide isomerase